MSDPSQFHAGNEGSSLISVLWSTIAATAGAVWFAVTRFATKKELEEAKAAHSELCTKAEVIAKFDALARRHDDLRQDVARYAARTEDQFLRVFEVMDDIRNRMN